MRHHVAPFTGQDQVLPALRGALVVLGAAVGCSAPGVPSTLGERAATFGPAESFGWFVLGALLLLVAVVAIVTIVRALR